MMADNEITVTGAFRICGAEQPSPKAPDDKLQGQICVEDPGHADGCHRWADFWREMTAEE
jgi:hypothetical protein